MLAFEEGSQGEGPAGVGGGGGGGRADLFPVVQIQFTYCTK